MDSVELSIGVYRVLAAPDKLPASHSAYIDHAVLAEQFNLSSPEGEFCFFAVGDASTEWPSLVVSQRYEPAGYGFSPGMLVVPETAVVFIGAGTRLLAYRLRPTPQRLWTDAADVGFWGWSRFDDVVFMSAELELAAWSLEGNKLWTTSVEPPWTFAVSGGHVQLDVMGQKASFPVREGPRPSN